MASQSQDLLHQLLDGLPDRLPPRRARALRVMLADLSDRELQRIVDQLQHDLPRIREAVRAYNLSDLVRPLFAQDWLLSWDESPRVDQGRLVLVGAYLIRSRGLVFWERILAGGLGGYLLFTHEWAEIQWFLEKHADLFLNAFLDLDQAIGYEVAHPIAILLEHLYEQVRAREDGKDFTLRELVLTNPQTYDGDGDWAYVAELVQSHNYPLDLSESGVHHLDEARQWYRDCGVQPLTPSVGPGAPTRGGSTRGS
jgi:hypothetical protein